MQQDNFLFSKYSILNCNIGLISLHTLYIQMKRTIFIHIVLFLLVLVFSYTAISKLSATDEFTAQLHYFPIFRALPPGIAVVIPIADAIVALLLIFPLTRNAGLWSSLVLLGLFTIYLIVIVITMPELPCTCGGVISQLNWVEHIVFNIGLSGLCLLALQQHHVTSRQSISKCNP